MNRGVFFIDVFPLQYANVDCVLVPVLTLPSILFLSLLCISNNCMMT